MEPEEQPVQSTSKVVFLGIGSVIIIIVLIVLIVSFARNRVQRARHMVSTGAEQSQLTDEITGRIGLSVKGSKDTFRRGDTVTLFVYADSQGQEITGYDAVLKYDPTQVTFVSVKSVIDGMDIYETEDELEDGTSELIITGIQSLSQGDPFVFDNTALAEVTFTMADRGPLDIDVVYEPGSQRESNLITSSNQDILSTVVGATLEVQ